MTNIFEETYNKVQELNRIYHSEEGKDEKVQESLRAEYQKAMDEIKALGDEACKIYGFYEKAKENENACINIDDIIWDREVEPIVRIMRENGIKEFTFSTTCTDAIETIWLFKEAGCEVGGMVEINARKSFWGEGFEKAHAFKLSVA